MKRTTLILLVLVFSQITLFGQNDVFNPFEKFDKDVEVLTLSNGVYDEFFDTDSIEIIGSAVLNTNTMKIIGFIEYDTLYSEATLEPELVSRWLSLDPLARKYPELSPYNFVANNPILYVDPDGREIWIYYTVTGASGTPVTKKVQYKNGALTTSSGAAYTGTNAYVASVKSDLDALRTDHAEAAYRLKTLENSTQIHNIENTSGGNSNTPASGADDRAGNPTGTTTKYDPTNWTNPRGSRRNPRVALGHELLGHGFDTDQGQTDYGTTSGTKNYEISALNIENKIRASTGDPNKTTYGGRTVPAASLEDPNSYKIKSGDTLYSIAKSSGTTVSNLVSLNSIADKSKIKAGETIKIR